MNRKFLRVGLTLVLGASLACSSVIARDKPIPDPIQDAQLASAKGKQTAVIAGGCFWGVEAVYEHVKGVIDVKSGYAGGTAASANYDRVSEGDTGHAEAVQIVFDPSKISYGTILKLFFSVVHDPTTLNRQGPDRGTQYRSAIFYQTDEQKQIAESYIKQLGEAKVFEHPIVTQVTSLPAFYTAEGYHQDYLEHHPDEPYIVAHDRPKLEALRKQYPALYRSR